MFAKEKHARTCLVREVQRQVQKATTTAAGFGRLEASGAHAQEPLLLLLLLAGRSSSSGGRGASRRGATGRGRYRGRRATGTAEQTAPHRILFVVLAAAAATATKNP